MHALVASKLDLKYDVSGVFSSFFFLINVKIMSLKVQTRNKVTA
jgi:hypothetical protein